MEDSWNVTKGEIKSSLSEVQSHWVHPCGPSGYNADAYMYTCGEPESRTWPVLALASWPEVNQRAPSLFARIQKTFCSESSRRKSQEPGQQLFPHPTEKNQKHLQSFLRPGSKFKTEHGWRERSSAGSLLWGLSAEFTLLVISPMVKRPHHLF